MNFTRPAITQGQWTPYTSTGCNSRKVYARLIQIVEFEKVRTIAEVPAEGNAADQQAISSVPAILAALESAYKRACERAARWNPKIHADGDADEYAGYCAYCDEYKAALQSAGYTFQ